MVICGSKIGKRRGVGPIEEEEEGTVSVFFLKKLKKLKKILAVFFF